MALEQSHRFQPAERTVQRPVRSQKAAVVLVAETFGYFVSVEFDRAVAAQSGRAHANGGFEWDQLPGLPSHLDTISRYMPIVKRMATRESQFLILNRKS